MRSQSAYVYEYTAVGDSHLLHYGFSQENQHLNKKDGTETPMLLFGGERPRKRRCATIISGTNSMDWLNLMPWWANSQKPLYLLSMGGNDLAQSNFKIHFVYYKWMHLFID